MVSGQTTVFSSLRVLLASIALPFVTLAIQGYFWDIFNPYVWFLFYPAVFVAAWFGGLRGAIISSIVSSAIVLWFFIPPTNSFIAEKSSAYFSIIVFIAFAVALGIIQEKLAAAKRNLEESNEKLKALDKLKTEFFSNISHEFRTPLTLMLSPSEELLLDTDAPKR